MSRVYFIRNRTIEGKRSSREDPLKKIACQSHFTNFIVPAKRSKVDSSIPKGLGLPDSNAKDYDIVFFRPQATRMK